MGVRKIEQRAIKERGICNSTYGNTGKKYREDCSKQYCVLQQKDSKELSGAAARTGVFSKKEKQKAQ